MQILTEDTQDNDYDKDRRPPQFYITITGQIVPACLTLTRNLTILDPYLLIFQPTVES